MEMLAPQNDSARWS